MKYLIDKTQPAIVHTFDSKNKTFTIQKQFGEKSVAIQIQSDYPGDTRYMVADVVYDRTNVPSEFATNVVRQPVKLVEMVPTIVVTGDTDFAAMGKKYADDAYAAWSEELDNSFSSVGITRTAQEAIVETTERFTALVAKVNNGGVTPQEQAEYDAVKAFNAAYLDPMMEARNNALKMLTRFVQLKAKATQVTLTPEEQGELEIVKNWNVYQWLTFDATISGMLETIIAIQLKLV